MAETFDARLVTGDEDGLANFMEESPHAIVVDWREEEENIVRSVAAVIAPDELSYSWRDDEDLVLRYKDGERPVGLTFTPRDRYVCLRAINDVLAGDYEIRLFEPSFYSDTHEFLVERVSWWNAFDAAYPARGDRFFREIDANLDFP